MMIRLRQSIQVHRAAQATHLGVGHGVDDSFEPGHQGGAGAHGAGFFGDVEGGTGEAPIINGFGGLAQGEDFGMGGGIAGAVALIVRGGDDFSVQFNDRADRDFVFLPRGDGLVIGEPHVKFVISPELRGVHFGEGARE